MLHLPWERPYRLVLRKFLRTASSHTNCSTVRLFRGYISIAGPRLNLLPRGVVAPAGAHLKILLEGSDLNRAEVPVRLKISRVVGDYVLAPQLVFNGCKRVLDVLHFVREERPSTGGVGDALQHFIAPQDQSAVIGRNRINDDFRPLRHFNRLRLAEVTLIVLAITHHDDGPSRRMVFVILDQIVVAGSIDGIVECRSSPVLHPVHCGGEQCRIISEVLHHLTMPVKAYDEGLIKIWAHGALQETDGGVLFEVKAPAHGTAGIDQKSKLNGQIGLAAKIYNGLRGLMVVEDREVFLVEVTHELTMPVGRNEEHIDFIHPLLDRDNGVVRLAGIRDRGRR